MKTINRLLEYADKALSASNIIENNLIKEVFKGYIASFGPAIIQNGLSAALAINMRTEGDAKDLKTAETSMKTLILAINMRTEGDAKEKIKIVDAIVYILKNGFDNKYDNINNADDLLDLSCKSETSIRTNRLLKEDVINASVALKHMMRTYKFKEKE